MAIFHPGEPNLGAPPYCPGVSIGEEVSMCRLKEHYCFHKSKRPAEGNAAQGRAGDERMIEGNPLPSKPPKDVRKGDLKRAKLRNGYDGGTRGKL